MATKKTPTPLEAEFTEFKQLFADLSELAERDEDGDFTSFRGQPYVMYNGDYFEVGDDYNGELNSFPTLAETKTFITQEIEMLRRELGSRVENLDGNYEYNANVTTEGIKVGCTTISFAKFDELVAKVAEVRPKPKATTTRKTRAKK